MSHTKLSKFIIILLVSTIFVSIAATPSFHKEYIPHTYALSTSAMSIPNGSLVFMDDSDLTDYGFLGNGSFDNPYLFDFENMTLEYSFNSTTVGIHIENITKHVIIRNLKLTNNNTDTVGTGIRILADNVFIDNVTIENTVNGIHLKGNNLRVHYTVINSNGYGIKAVDCTSLNITNTNVTGADYGAYFESCNQTLLFGNRFENGRNGIQMYGCINFRIADNFIKFYTEKGLLIVETPPKTGSLNIVIRNRFVKNEIQAVIVSDDINTVFYDATTNEGNFWSDWRGWGKYKIQIDVVDLYPMKIINLNEDIELAPQYPFKFWFWIFAPIIVVLGVSAYFLYWKLIIQPTKE